MKSSKRKRKTTVVLTAGDRQVVYGWLRQKLREANRAVGVARRVETMGRNSVADGRPASVLRHAGGRPGDACRWGQATKMHWLRVAATLRWLIAQLGTIQKRG